MPDRAVIERQRRVFDQFFKVDELIVSHRRVDGQMSAPQRRLVFERGDAAAVLIWNADSRTVVLVEQFRAPALVGRRRDDPSTGDGWTLEPVAGMIEPHETPAETAIREAFEETGYRIAAPQLIGRFFPSPGGSSERIFLHFSEVRDADRVGRGGGEDGEDLRVVRLPAPELFERLNSGLIEDAKLVIAAGWLANRLQSD